MLTHRSIGTKVALDIIAALIATPIIWGLLDYL